MVVQGVGDHGFDKFALVTQGGLLKPALDNCVELWTPGIEKKGGGARWPWRKKQLPKRVLGEAGNCRGGTGNTIDDHSWGTLEYV